ncbi:MULTISPECIES: DUF1707 SHOCT-like domain-containing protein [Aestuariimicrobium]|uniref:DUF1707 SHOCT-like domain-containing protein n=1 Tax=Aestuariimicrobium TaxID=396388 RepID=UPI0003B34764|nr:MULTISPECIES: DUF1707 domain-containing protein [Aestuariimicrobium]CAI9410904.1 hypothetical protein AESSP_02537 [Aestuariimicrobium sp. T2.26MG-19.2B]
MIQPAPALPPASQHPSLSLLVTEAQRDRALAYLQNAYAEGRITAEELDQRVGQALLARTRADLNRAFAGLVSVPLSSAAVGAHPAYAPMLNQHRDGRTGKGAAGFAHFSALALGFIGPAITYAATSPGTFAHREAAKSFNTQIALSIAMVGAIIVGAIIDPLSWVTAVVGLAWLIVTVVGGAKAASGEDSDTFLTSINPIKLLNDSGKPRELGR